MKTMNSFWVAGLLALGSCAYAADQGADHGAEAPIKPIKRPLITAPAENAPKGDEKAKQEDPHAEKAPAATKESPKEVGNRVREALANSSGPNSKLTLVIKPTATGGHDAPAAVKRPARTPKSHAAVPATGGANAHGHDVHWAYEGESGPMNWGKLKPEFNLCAIGKRQSPINIQESATLQGPAQPISFSYNPSTGSVVNNGHTIQVDVQGDNSITVRGANYRLLQFHFHTPSEEQVNFKRFPMVAHLVHKNSEGQLAVVAVLLELGANNPLIDKVWTDMPLDAGDRVQMPPELLDLTELLPADQRYYQFMGSLTTPPCSEGVLWMVMKQPVSISKAQYRLFTQLYPLNARPIQPLNGRPVRDAQ